MTKNIFQILITYVVFILISSKVYADTTTINGSTTLKDTAFESLSINGSLNFRKLEIKKDLNVNGSVDGTKLKCRKLNVNGSLRGEKVKVEYAKVKGSLFVKDFHVKHDLEVEGGVQAIDIAVAGKTRIDGDLSATDGEFSAIEVMNTKTYLNKCKVKDIVVKKIAHSNKIQKLDLIEGTIVSGDVIFESGEGEIYLSNDSIIKGTVKGAQIIKDK